VLAALADVAARLGGRRVPRLTVAESAASPVVLGTSEICVPRRFLSDLTPEEQSGVLAHEVAHLVRRDPWWLLLAVTLESLFFFQPLNRLARVRLQDEAELLSDALAVRGRRAASCSPAASPASPSG
jgi:beta-lactamase regulating signal transducer with metallopeptidase domain